MKISNLKNKNTVIISSNKILRSEYDKSAPMLNLLKDAGIMIKLLSIDVYKSEIIFIDK